MKSLSLPSILLAVCAAALAAGVPFDAHFEDAALRIDYFHTGHRTSETVSLDQLYRIPTWPAHPDKLIDDLNYGPYQAKVYDVATNTLIFSRGFSSIFAEYKTTAPAREGIAQTYHATVLIPFPRKPVLLVLEARDRQNILAPIYRTNIDPADINIIKESPDPRDRIHTIAHAGPPRDCVDIVFVAEGYTEPEYDKFTADAERFAKVLLDAEPFKTHSEKINISAVFRASAESGVDEPDNGIFRNTALSSAYNALNLERYLLVDDNKTLRDVACQVPHDTVVVIANSPRYGGGGIYNDYAIFTADHRTSENIFLHEFGHSFANLADEYFSADVAYEEFFAPGVEPLEPNITALLDPDNVKWKNLLSPDIPIPTPWGQEELKSLRAQRHAIHNEINEKIARLENKKSKNEEKIQLLRNKLTAKITQIEENIEEITRRNNQMGGKTGVFEGAGYTAKGLYRPTLHTDFTTGLQYHQVARHAIQKLINHYAPESPDHIPH